MKILVKFPTRQRPHKFKSVIQQYSDMALSNNIEFLVSLDLSDPDLMDYIRNKPELRHNVFIQKGNSRTKIQAINADINSHESDWNLLVLASDDMIPQVKNWDKRIVNDMNNNYADGDGVLYYFDGFQNLNTIPIMGRKYYERFNYIYHPSYMSLWCDNEFEEVADILGKQTRFPDVIFRHETYFNSPEFNHTNDFLMKRNQSFFKIDKQNYDKRKARNFGISIA